VRGGWGDCPDVVRGAPACAAALPPPSGRVALRAAIAPMGLHRCSAGVAPLALPACSAAHQIRCLTISTRAAPPPATTLAAGSAQPPPPSGASRLRRGLLICLKCVVLWIPALLFWVSLAWGAPILDFRTDEELEDEENEVRRLERFFDVEGLPEADYLSEWTVKEEALEDIVDKLLRSTHFLELLIRGPQDAYADEAAGNADAHRSPAWAQKQRQAHLLAEADYVEVSYVLPPPIEEPLPEGDGSLDAVGPRPWHPRLVLAHRDGGLALVMLSFEYVVRGKDREERWACTSLRGDLVAAYRGEPTYECICDLQGPVPHGVRYMRI